MKRYNITTCKTYQSKGEEKKSWPNVGTLVQFPATIDRPEGFKLELNMYPDVQFFVFEQKGPQEGGYREPSVSVESPPKVVATPKTTAGKRPLVLDGIEYPSEEINANDIPF